jgi:hypothetical protein
MVQVLGYRVLGVGCRVYGLRLSVERYGLWNWVTGYGLWVIGIGLGFTLYSMHRAARESSPCMTVAPD